MEMGLPPPPAHHQGRLVSASSWMAPCLVAAVEAPTVVVVGNPVAAAEGPAAAEEGPMAAVEDRKVAGSPTYGTTRRRNRSQAAGRYYMHGAPHKLSNSYLFFETENT